MFSTDDLSTFVSAHDTWGLKHIAVLNKNSTTAALFVQVRDKWWAVMKVVMDIGRFLGMLGVSWLDVPLSVIARSCQASVNSVRRSTATVFWTGTLVSRSMPWILACHLQWAWWQTTRTTAVGCQAPQLDWSCCMATVGLMAFPSQETRYTDMLIQ